MEPIDAKTVGAVAARFQLPRAPVEKALRLVTFIEECAKDAFLKDRLVLKGGTALNLFYGDFARLSIDADFDYIGAIEKTKMQKEHDRVIARLDEVGVDLGFSPELAMDAYAGATLFFRYETLFGSQDLIKADVNFLNRLPILGKTVPRAASIGLGDERTTVPCLVLDEIAGLKLGTLCVRAAPRDLFDVARFAEFALDRDRVRKIALFRGFLESLDLELFDPGAASRIKPSDLKKEVYTLLRDRRQPTREEMMAAATPWLSALLPLRDREKEFQTMLLKGKADATLLFDPFAVHDRINDHPALLRRIGVKKPSAREGRVARRFPPQK